ncbi:MAG: ABC transporter permease [Deinococcus sp.]|nr:ABC transporter permease [Deinococcus sp.]MCL5964483.1 ABC transporter permease [Deinococcus sp.]
MTMTASKQGSEKRETFWTSRPVRRFRRNKLAIVGLSLVTLFVLVAVFAPLLAPAPKVGNNCQRDLGITDPRQVYNIASPMFWKAVFAPPPSCYQIARINYRAEPSPPGKPIQTEFGEVRPLVGTSNGYDVWYGLVWGSRTALKLAVIVVSFNVLIGIIFGSLSGYFGGWVDNLIQRLIDIIFAFPGLVLIIVITTLLGPSLTNVMIAFVATGWAGYARVLRGEVLKVKALEFVDGARALGAADTRIMFRHILPNALTAVTAIAVLDLGSLPLSAAALSFLGIGLPIGFADWGQLINAAKAWIQGPYGQPFAYWYVSFFPAMTIILFGLGWNLLGGAVRDALDPRD